MHETSKALKRREKETDFPWTEIFQGRGLDVGSGDDPLRITGCEPFDLPDGGGDDITKFVEGKFDYVHGSQVLEHALDPRVMLESWISVLNPKGYIIATVPDWELYEKKVWPSQWNAGHRSIWTMGDRPHYDDRNRPDICIKLPEWLNPLHCEILRCQLVDTNYDYSINKNIDQTFDPINRVEAFIEFVLQKPGA